jgi:DNA-binding MarR family transcriptional regulator
VDVLNGNKPFQRCLNDQSLGFVRDLLHEASMRSEYIELIALIERMHRQFLEIVNLELVKCGVHDINGMQAMIVYNIGDLEMTVGELTLRGCHLGSNLSYNVKSLQENGYIVRERSSHDRRSVRVRLSEKGMDLHQKLKRMHERHMASLAHGELQGEDMAAAQRTLHRLERFWSRAVDLGSRAAALAPAA